MEAVQFLKQLESNSVDILFTDPPYFIPSDYYGTRKQWPKNLSDMGILDGYFWLFFQECKRIVKPSGAILSFCDDHSYPIFFCHVYPFLRTVRAIVWDKGHPFLGRDWRHQYEFIMFAPRTDRKGKTTGYGDVIRYDSVKIGERKHPAQKPVGLITKILRDCMQNGDSVLCDPFSGTGAIGQAAKGLGFTVLESDYDAGLLDTSPPNLDSPWAPPSGGMVSDSEGP